MTPLKKGQQLMHVRIVNVTYCTVDGKADETSITCVHMGAIL